MNATKTQKSLKSRHIDPQPLLHNGTEVAAIDLGSNSFHMVTARAESETLHITDRIQEKVQLARSLTQTGDINDTAFHNGLDCLKRFAQRLRTLPHKNIRIVGTYALRSANNARLFQEAAQEILGHPIEIISGREEARLIYLGVTHRQPQKAHNQLVIDIGGGSTEFIIGQQYKPLATESLHMGSISLQRFFPKGVLKPAYLKHAVLFAKQELQNISKTYQAIGWQDALGCSGTIRSIETVLLENQWSSEGITQSGLEKLEKAILKASSFQELKINGLKEDRKSIFVPGFAILKAIFRQLNLKKLQFTDSALREGLLFDLLDRQQYDDTRDKTIQWLQKHYLIEGSQSDAVTETCLFLFQCIETHSLATHSTHKSENCWHNPTADCQELLKRAAQLHEIGLFISHSQFHKHGAYILTHADLPGFSTQEQERLALLVRHHRRKILAPSLENLSPSWRQDCWQLMIILRLAVILHRSRFPINHQAISQLYIDTQNKVCELSLSADWLSEHPLTEADLKEEQTALENCHWHLILTST